MHTFSLLCSLQEQCRVFSSGEAVVRWWDLMASNPVLYCFHGGTRMFATKGTLMVLLCLETGMCSREWTVVQLILG